MKSSYFFPKLLTISFFAFTLTTHLSSNASTLSYKTEGRIIAGTCYTIGGIYYSYTGDPVITSLFALAGTINLDVDINSGLKSLQRRNNKRLHNLTYGQHNKKIYPRPGKK